MHLQPKVLSQSIVMCLSEKGSHYVPQKCQLSHRTVLAVSKRVSYAGSERSAVWGEYPASFAFDVVLPHSAEPQRSDLMRLSEYLTRSRLPNVNVRLNLIHLLRYRFLKSLGYSQSAVT